MVGTVPPRVLLTSNLLPRPPSLCCCSRLFLTLSLLLLLSLSPSAVLSSSFSSPSNMSAVSQCVSIASHTPRLLSLSYQSALLSSSPVTSPFIPFPSYEDESGWTGSSALLPVTSVISSLPSPISSIQLYENVNGLRGAAIVSIPHTLPSLDLWVVGWTGGAAESFTFYVQSSLGSSTTGDVVVNVSSTYLPPSFPSSSVTVATFRNEYVAYFPLSSYVRLDRQWYNSSSPPISVVYTFPTLPTQGELYALPVSLVLDMAPLAPFLNAVDPYDPLSFSLPTVLPSGVSNDALNRLQRWQIPVSVSSIIDGSATLLLYRSNVTNATATSDSFQVQVDDGLSTMPGERLTVNIQLLTDDDVISSTPPSTFSVAAYSAGNITLPCVQSSAPSSQCRISLLTLPGTGQISTNGTTITAVPYPLVNNTLVFTPTDNSITATQTTELTYVAYNGVANSTYKLTVTIVPAPAPPSCTSFSVESVDYAEVLVRLTAASLNDSSSYQAVITSLPSAAVGSLVTSNARMAIIQVPFTMPLSTSPQLIFTPNTNTSTIASSSTSFTYYVVEQNSQLACKPSTVSVVLGTAPPSPFVPVSSLLLQTTQVDPVVVTLSANSAIMGPVRASITSLPLNGTLYQYQTLPSHLLFPQVSALLGSLVTQSTSWTSVDSPSSQLSANSSYTEQYNYVSALVQSACLTSAAVSCLPPSVMLELVPITGTASVVLDPLLRLLYVPARFAVADWFAYTVYAPPVSRSSIATVTVNAANTGTVSIQVQAMDSPPSPLPPLASSTSPLSRYLPTLDAYQLAVYQDDELDIVLQANSGYSTAATTDVTLDYFVSRLPVNGTLFWQNASCGGCWMPVPTLFSPVTNATAPFPVGQSLKFTPSLGQSGAPGVSYLYASFDFFVADSLGSTPPTSIDIFVYPPLEWPTCVSPSVQAVRGQQTVIALGNWVDLSLTVLVHTLPSHGLLHQSTADGQASRLVWRRETSVSDSLLKLVYVPYANSSLPFAYDVFTYSVYNASTQLLSSVCTINISLVTVQPIPVATSLIVNTTENNPVAFALGCSLQPCIYSILSLPTIGQLSLSVTVGNATNLTAITSTGLLLGSGELQFAPVDYDSGDPMNYNYYANFTYIALPVNSNSSTSLLQSAYSNTTSPPWSPSATVTLQVSQVNYAPTFTDQNVTVAGDSYLVISLAANNSKSQPAVAYTVTIAKLPANGTLYQYSAQNPTSPMGSPIPVGGQVAELDINGDLDSGTNVVFVPTEFQHGVNYANFSFYATDSTTTGGKTATFVVNINVTPRNHAPVATPLSFTIDGSNNNQMVSINLLDAASDVDGDEIFYSITSWPLKGVLWSCERLPEKDLYDGAYEDDTGQQQSTNSECDPEQDSIIPPTELSPVATLNISNFIDSSGYGSYNNSSVSAAGGNVTLSLNVTAVIAQLLSGQYRNVINSSLHFSLENTAAFYPYLNFTYTAFDAHLANTSSSITILLHCPPGSSPNIWESTGLPCISCPTGAQCSTDGTYPPYPMPGYWPMMVGADSVSDGGDMVFVLCHPTSACLGGVSTQCASCQGGMSAPCATGYEGLLCGSCQPGFVRLDVQCVECPSAFLFFTAISVGGCVLLSVLAVLLLSKHRLSFSSSFILLSFFQTVSVFNNYNLRWPNSVSSLFTAVSLSSFNVDLFAVKCYIPFASYPHKWVGTILLLPAVMLLIAAVWVCWVAVQWAGMRYMLWRARRSDRPLLLSSASWLVFQSLVQSSITRMLRYQTIWLLCAFLPLLAKACQLFECAELPDGTVQFYPDSSLQCTQNWHVTLVPFAILFIVVYSLFAVIWVAGGISKHVPRGVRWSGWTWSSNKGTGARTQRSVDSAKAGTVEKALEAEVLEKHGAVHDPWTSLASPTSSTPFFSLPHSSPTSFQTLTSPAPSSAASVAAAAASAIPSSSASMATFSSTFTSKRLTDVDYIDAAFAFLTSPFKPIYFYWYLIVVLRLFLLAVTCLLYPAIPIVSATMALLVLLVSALLQCILAPYRSSSLNRLELVCLLTAAFVLFCGVIFKGDTAASMTTSALSDLFIVFVFIALSLAIAFASFIYWRKVERLLYCRRCRRVPTLHVKSAEMVNKLGRTARERVQDRRDLAPVRSKKVDKHTQERERAEMVRAATAQQLYMDELKQHDRLHSKQRPQAAEKWRDGSLSSRDDEDTKTAAPFTLPAATVPIRLPFVPLSAAASSSSPVVLLPSAPLRPAVSDPSSPVSSANALLTDISLSDVEVDSPIQHELPALFVLGGGNSRQLVVPPPVLFSDPRVDLRGSGQRGGPSPTSPDDAMSIRSDERSIDGDDSDDSCVSRRSASSALCLTP